MMTAILNSCQLLSLRAQSPLKAGATLVPFEESLRWQGTYVGLTTDGIATKKDCSLTLRRDLQYETFFIIEMTRGVEVFPAEATTGLLVRSQLIVRDPSKQRVAIYLDDVKFSKDRPSWYLYFAGDVLRGFEFYNPGYALDWT